MSVVPHRLLSLSASCGFMECFLDCSSEVRGETECESQMALWDILAPATGGSKEEWREKATLKAEL